MISPNIVNFITVGIIAVVFIVLLRIGFKAAGKNAPV